MRLLLDTNILIDFFNEREGFYEDALRLLMSSYHGDNELWASAGSFTDIFHILTRGGIDRSQLQDAFINRLDYLRICPIDQDDIMHVAQHHWHDFEDHLIAEAAEKARADLIITRNKSGFADSSIPAISPAALFDRLEKEHGITYELIDL